MTEDTRIRMKFKPKRIFQMRVAGIAFRDGHVLVHRATHEKFWSFPGGRAEMGEQSQDTLAREMVEELGVEAQVGRLLWVVENFFHYEGKDWHELGFTISWNCHRRSPSTKKTSSTACRMASIRSSSAGLERLPKP